jgi:hypothetical protein
MHASVAAVLHRVFIAGLAAEEPMKIDRINLDAPSFHRLYYHDCTSYIIEYP